jgi:hypothetical protein
LIYYNQDRGADGIIFNRIIINDLDKRYINRGVIKEIRKEGIILIRALLYKLLAAGSDRADFISVSPFIARLIIRSIG